ncbi:MAG TPA: helix-turn-helix domain-containing protein [Anaerolineae bacterium]|nr:helix-turn-helix domain-containing protein [Anaerolineae bacterium]
MAEIIETLLTAKEACEYLRVSLFTLRKMEKQGLLKPFRTPGGHRRYSLEMLNEYLERSRNCFDKSEGEGSDREGDLPQTVS